MTRIFYIFACSFFLTACVKHDDHENVNDLKDIVYFQTNNFNGNQNAILAYKMTASGGMEQIAGSPFPTGGSGVGNPEQILGPSDSDQELIITQDKKYLLAVNSGSNNITVFKISTNGKLSAVSGSPFSSNGQTPVSIGIRGKYVYVVNKSQDPLRTITDAPNYTVFTMSDGGSLTSVPSSTIVTTSGSSPAQAFVSKDGKYLFGADFLGFQVGVGTLRSFSIHSDGTLSSAPNSPQAIPGMGGALGLWQHPHSNVLYVGFPLQGKVGVYSINNGTGNLEFQTTVPAGLAACWIRVNPKGDRFYALNSGENTISIFNSSTPAAPSTLGKLALKNSGPTYMAMGLSFTTSEPFSFDFSSSGDYLYVLNQHTNPDFSIGNYNFLHVIKVEANGSLSEPGEPIQIPVTNTLRPKGIVVYNARRT